jgi:hypothetical protein
MNVKQIANILNTTIVPETIGESAVVKEDLSNIVDVGRQITESAAFGDNFDNIFKKLVNRIGKVIFVDRPYTSKAPNILRDSWEYGSALEKVRCELPESTDSAEWTLASLNNGDSIDPFVINKPDLTVKLFNNKSTFTIPLTFGRKQVKESFTSAEDINRLFAMIENRIIMAQTMNVDAMSQRCVNNLIANKIHDNKNIVNLLAVYRAETGDTTLTAAHALTNSAFLRSAAKTIAQYKGFIATPSTLYNDESYVTFTPEDRQKFVVLTEFAKAMDFYSYADTYHDNFVVMDGYTEIPYWQGSGTDNSFTSHSTINLTAVDMSGDDFTANQAGIVGVLFDEQAALICCEDYETEAIYNPRGKYTNYFYSYDVSYMNDTAENCVVFIIADVTGDQTSSSKTTKTTTK